MIILLKYSTYLLPFASVIHSLLCPLVLSVNFSLQSLHVTSLDNVGSNLQYRYHVQGKKEIETKLCSEIHTKFSTQNIPKITLKMSKKVLVFLAFMAHCGKVCQKMAT